MRGSDDVSLFAICAFRYVLVSDPDHAPTVLDFLRQNEELIDGRTPAMLLRETDRESALVFSHEEEAFRRTAEVIRPWAVETTARRAAEKTADDKWLSLSDVRMKGDVDTMALLAFRYALPRHTYVTSFIPEFISRFRTDIKRETLLTIADEIRAYLSETPESGAFSDIDRRSWASFEKAIRTDFVKPD